MMTLIKNLFTAFTLTLLAACGGASDSQSASTPAPMPEPANATAGMPEEQGVLAPIRVSGSYWIELSPVIVAANRYYPEQLEVGSGGITRITSGEADIATNAETQLLRESLKNPDLRIIATVTESFYRLVARRSAGIETLADLEGKRVMLPRNTSANYYLVAMLETVGLTEDDVTLLSLPPADGDIAGMQQMSTALANGDTDVISIWEPEPHHAIEALGDDAIVFQDRSVYREVFNLHSRASDLSDPDKRHAIVTYLKALLDARDALAVDPEPLWPLSTAVTGFTVEEIEASWPEMAFPIDIIPDMLDVLEREDKWVAKERDREPRTREELAVFIDRSPLEEAKAMR